MNNQNIFTSKEKWNETFNRWLISDCALRTNKMVNLILRKDLNDKELSKLWDSEVPTRLVTINLEFSRIGYADFDNGFAFPRAGVARKPVIQGLTASRNRIGQVYSVNADLKQMEEITPIGKTEPSKGIATQKLKCIDGWAYAIGSFRDIYKRVDIGKWEPVMNGFPKLTSEQIRNGFFGFEDLDGHNESNMYAVGGHGDVWRYDGTRWHQCDFPSNEQLNTVTVAPTGEVYISGEGGNLWVGEKNTWKKIAKGYSSVLFNDSVWFNNQLWLCSGYQLKVWDGKELKTPEHNGELITYNGHMDAYDGLLVVASNYEVHAFNGNEWQCLVAPYQ
ncbi:hypothetical protein [Cellvibrio sp. pealriver]|uniref:hypothetical protein n=1 Tax=Cellvibrio sp. pealriver TaxID=1622269 RepID=UPI000A85FB8B|nr:hypothetical protein [Cellvibrio sp. pealriver]